MTQLPALLSVALGGAIGALLRHLAVTAFGAPWTVVAVNALGSFLIGLTFVALADLPAVALFVMTGVLGGFTTFSAFTLDTLKLWEAGQFAQAALYVGTSVLISLGAVTLGVSLARSLS